MTFHRSTAPLLYGRLTPWLTVMDDYRVGQVVTGTVSGVMDHGMLVELETGLVALLKGKEIDWVSTEPMELLQVGDVVDVRILSIEPERQRMNVSRRVLLPDPKDAFLPTARVGAVYLGTVRKCMDYGAFVEIAPGVRGLFHISEMQAGSQELSDGKGCHLGDQVRVRIVDIDRDRRRISLGWAAD